MRKIISALALAAALTLPAAAAERPATPLFDRLGDSVMGTFAASVFPDSAYGEFRFTCRFLENVSASDVVSFCRSAPMRKTDPTMLVRAERGRLAAVSLVLDLSTDDNVPRNAQAIDVLVALFITPEGRDIDRERVIGVRRKLMEAVIAKPLGTASRWSYPDATVTAKIVGSTLTIDVDAPATMVGAE